MEWTGPTEVQWQLHTAGAGPSITGKCKTQYKEPTIWCQLIRNGTFYLTQQLTLLISSHKK